MARERRERDRAGISRALGVLMVVLPWALVQGLMGLLAADADERRDIDCGLRYDPNLLAGAS